MDVPSLLSASSGSHTHTVAVGASGADPASGALPYLQLLACRKD
jgi:hypothetical protein